MNSEDKSYDVLISGGGPTGLLLGILLSRYGISNAIIEKQSDINSHSRSIGIHPPSLKVLKKARVLQDIINAGVIIKQGHAMTDIRNKLGTIPFDLLRDHYPFILTVPQNYTEHILQQAVHREEHAELIHPAEVVSFTQDENEVAITVRQRDNEMSLSGSFLVACDGKNSLIREKTGISSQANTYPYSYVMGDFTDETLLGDDAVIFVTNKGLVESFPLPGNIRRWVVETSDDRSEQNARQLSEIVQERIGTAPNPATNSMLSNFGAERLLASQFRDNRVLLAGDAAHVVSPIGGQGMNLGWLDAAHLAEACDAIINGNAPVDATLDHYALNRKRQAGRAIKRAEFNMALGHQSKIPGMRNSILKLLLKPPANRIMVQRFTMAGLDS